MNIFLLFLLLLIKPCFSLKINNNVTKNKNTKNIKNLIKNIINNNKQNNNKKNKQNNNKKTSVTTNTNTNVNKKYNILDIDKISRIDYKEYIEIII
jgi:hypothetical protein